MRVFLAGGTGFVGGEVLQRLQQDGHDVTLLLRDPKKVPPGFSGMHVEGDISKSGPWQDALEGHEAAINCVGILRETGGAKFQPVVVEGTRNLVEGCVRGGVKRFVQISANGIEPAQVPYQTTKLEAERIVKEASLTWTMIRPSFIFGARDNLTNLYARWMRLPLFPYFGEGDYRMAPVAMEDVGETIVRSLRRKEAENQTFTLCGTESFSYKDFLREIRDASGRRCAVVWAPKWFGRLTATLFGRFEWFPADRDTLTMLFAGNTCPENRWRGVFDIHPIPFREGIRRYLGTRGLPAPTDGAARPPPRKEAPQVQP